MRIVPTLVWQLDGDPAERLDERLLPLLEAVSASQSLAAAVDECGISYRAAWGLLRDYRRKLGVSLVTLERGRGASLTEAGERLLDARRLAARRLARILPSLGADIGSRAQPMHEASTPALRIAASHDLALAALAEVFAKSCGLKLELSFMGSLHAINSFAHGDADLAGFHLRIGRAVAADARAALRQLASRRDHLIRFADREQGLILPAGNPQHLRTIRDVAATGVRFLNRQRGSGTRLIIDELIGEALLNPSDINGYNVEEFTHGAVAATVASGGADAGFGLRAAAAEYRLGFVPLVRERYFLATRAKDLESAAVRRLIEALHGPVCARTVRKFAGYDIKGAGSVCGVEDLNRVQRSETRKAT
jgi:molybdate transport repressor ModE-like protein